MPNLPKDTNLYNSIKSRIYDKYTIHSAYRSGLLVKEYKKAYEKNINPMMHILGKKQARKD